MQQFTFILKDTTQKAFNSFYWFLLFLHVIIISIVLIKGVDAYHSNVAWVALFLVSIPNFIYPSFKDKVKLIIFQRVIFLLMIGFWVALFAWIPAIVLMGIIIFASFVSSNKSRAIFSGENIIIIKSLFRKTYQWSEIENVVLKDRLLSVDFKNNYLIQIEISPESYAIDEATFNQFCHQHLKP